MATTINNSFFWNNGDYYGQTELALAFGAIMSPGVAQSSGTMGMAVSKTSATVVSVASGLAGLSGCAFMNNASATSLTVTVASNLSKIGRVVARADFANMRTELDIIYGTEESSPSAPALTRNSSYYEICLAEFTVGTSGISGDITDTRSDTDLCGPLRAKVSDSEFNTFYNNCVTRFNAYMTQCATDAWRKIYTQSTTPSGTISEGTLWLNTDTNVLKEYVSSAWVERRVLGTKTLVKGSKTVTVNNDNKIAFLSSTQINSLFGRTSSNPVEYPTVLACNGDWQESSSILSAVIRGVCFRDSDDTWIAMLDKTITGTIRINYTVIAGE